MELDILAVVIGFFGVVVLGACIVIVKVATGVKASISDLGFVKKEEIPNLIDRNNLMSQPEIENLINDKIQKNSDNKFSRLEKLVQKLTDRLDSFLEDNRKEWSMFTQRLVRVEECVRKNGRDHGTK